MRRFVLIVAALAAMTTVTMAQSSKVQERMSIGFSPEIAVPMLDDIGEYGGMGMGVSARGEYEINDMMSAGMNIGYLMFIKNEVDEGDFSSVPAEFTYWVLPVEGYFKYQLSAVTPGLYAQGILGVVQSSKTETETQGAQREWTTSETGIAFGVGAGYAFLISEKMSMDGGLRFETDHTLARSYFGVRIGFLYHL